MTAWQTALRRESSTAEIVIPEFVSPQKQQPAVAAQSVTDFVLLARTFAERAIVACKWLQQKGTQKFSSRRLRVTETVALGEKRFVTILQVDGNQLLIGSAAGQVSLLAVLDTEQSVWRAGSSQEHGA